MPITPTDRYNMKTMGLSVRQYRKHQRFMNTPRDQWPKELYDFCGDVLNSPRHIIAGRVADWIKNNG